jgi:hypothetical protein
MNGSRITASTEKKIKQPVGSRDSASSLFEIGISPAGSGYDHGRGLESGFDGQPFYHRVAA